MSARGIQRKADRQTSHHANACMHILRNNTVACRCLIAFVGLIATAFVSDAQVSQSSESGSGDAYTLQLNANLVILSATVLDRQNMHVSGLSEDDFRVYEDGVLQQIRHFSHEDSPVTVGLVIDNSSSMARHRDDVIAAALAFTDSRNSQDQAFVVKFNERVTFGLPPDMPFTDQKLRLRQALSGIVASGETALYDGIAAALDHLKQSTRDKRVLILISDGGDNASVHTSAQVINMAQHSTAIIYVIGIFDEEDDDRNPAILRRLAKETGGEAFFPQSFKDIGSLCEEIAHDIRDQYTLAYVPTRIMHGDRYRTIKVTANAPGRGHLSVRTRTGYSPSTNVRDSSGKEIPHDTHH